MKFLILTKSEKEIINKLNINCSVVKVSPVLAKDGTYFLNADILNDFENYSFCIDFLKNLPSTNAPNVTKETT